MADTRQRRSQNAIQASIWSYMSLAGGRVLTFLSTIILARILVPEHFGLVALCLMAIQYFEILNMFGLDGAVIAEDDEWVQPAANAATLTSVGIGLGLYGAAWFSAPLIADFFGEPEFASLFRVLALVLPIAGLGVVPSALLQRTLRFRRKLIPDLTKGLVKGGVAIILAWQGFEAWSLIYAQLAGAATETILNYAASGWRPTLEFDRATSRRVMGFGSHITSVGILGALRNNVDYLLIGKILGATALGYYSVAYRIPELIIRTINYAVSKVMFPLLSQSKSNIEELSSTYLSYVRYISLLTVPAGVGIAVLSPTLITTIFSDTWKPAIPVMQLVAIAVAIASIGHVPGVLYKAVGRPDILNRLSILKVPPVLALLWFSTRWGINGVAGAQVAIAVFSLILDSYYVTHFTATSWKDLSVALSPTITGSLAMAAGIVVFQSTVGMTGYLAIGVMMVIGASIFLLSLTLTSRQIIIEATSALQGAFAKA